MFFLAFAMAFGHGIFVSPCVLACVLPLLFYFYKKLSNHPLALVIDILKYQYVKEPYMHTTVKVKIERNWHFPRACWSPCCVLAWYTLLVGWQGKDLNCVSVIQLAVASIALYLVKSDIHFDVTVCELFSCCCSFIMVLQPHGGGTRSLALGVAFMGASVLWPSFPPRNPAGELASFREGPEDNGEDRDLKAALLESAEQEAQKKQQWDEEVSLLGIALNGAEEGAVLDQTTPTDGHCLFHALAHGGLLRDIPGSLTIQQLRSLAVTNATAEQLEHAALASDPPVSVAEYSASMRQGSIFGDNLMIAVLAVCFKTNIVVVSHSSSRTFLATGGEQEGTAPDAVWLAHLPEQHYFGVHRAGSPAAQSVCLLPASSRGQTLEVRCRQDKACGGIGKRRLVRNVVRVRKGKKRQHGGRLDDDEPDDAPSDEGGAAPPYAAIAYCAPRQRSPDCVRGGKRECRGHASKSQRGLSWHGIQELSALELCSWCFDAGFIWDRRGDICPKCKEYDLTMHPDKASYVCSGPKRRCRHEETVTSREPGLFLERVPLAKQLQVLYRMVYHNSPGSREIAADVDMDDGVVLHIMKHARGIATFWMRRANALLQIGGVDMDCELDEVSFRSKKVSVPTEEGNDVEEKVFWWRFLAGARRGSFLVYLVSRTDLASRLAFS